MARFAFRLEKVLRIKEIRENEARLHWGKAQRALEEALRYLDELKQERVDVIAYGYGQSDVALRSATYQFLSRLDKRIEGQQTEVELATDRVEQARQRYLQARQEREVLEKLRERQYEAYVKEQRRLEQNRLDEMKGRSEQL